MTLLPKKFVVNDQGEPLEVIISWQEYQEITELLEKFRTLTKLTQPQTVSSYPMRTLPEGIPGYKLLKFAGLLEPAEGQLILDAIEQDCRNSLRSFPKQNN
jgi:hypothetical protein